MTILIVVAYIHARPRNVRLHACGARARMEDVDKHAHVRKKEPGPFIPSRNFRDMILICTQAHTCSFMSNLVVSNQLSMPSSLNANIPALRTTPCLRGNQVPHRIAHVLKHTSPLHAASRCEFRKCGRGCAYNGVRMYAADLSVSRSLDTLHYCIHVVRFRSQCIHIDTAWTRT